VFLHKSTNKDGTVPTNPRECGHNFEQWENFDEEVEAFYSGKCSQIGSTVVDFSPGLMESLNCGSEYEVQDRFLTNIAKPLKVLLSSLGVPSFFKRATGDDQVLFDPDFVWKIGNETECNLGVVIEVKSWWSFEMFKNVVTQYEKEIDYEKDTKLVKGIHQIYGYMSYNYLRYGILTTYKGAYFLKRSTEKSKQSILSISQPKFLTQKSFLKYWLFVLFQSYQEGFYSSPTGDPFCASDKPIEAITLSPNCCRYDLHDIRSSQISFADNVVQRVVNKGCVGSVISGSISACEEDIKLKMLDSFNNDKALEICKAEISFYKQLESLQGSLIPKFYGFFNLHGFLILALEDCGNPITESEYLQFKDEIDAAVAQIESFGVSHCDLECRGGIYPNILNKDGSIRIIDFHVSTFQTNAPKRTKYS
jgi:hypothetical protein